MVVSLYEKMKISAYYISIFAALSFHNSQRSMNYNSHLRNDIFVLLFVLAKIIAKALKKTSCFYSIFWLLQFQNLSLWQQFLGRKKFNSIWWRASQIYFRIIMFWTRYTIFSWHGNSPLIVGKDFWVLDIGNF